jgi:hypothetical protein
MIDLGLANINILLRQIITGSDSYDRPNQPLRLNPATKIFISGKCMVF